MVTAKIVRVQIISHHSRLWRLHQCRLTALAAAAAARAAKIVCSDMQPPT